MHTHGQYAGAVPQEHLLRLQPALGKMITAVAGYLAGFDGRFGSTRSGWSTDHVPLGSGVFQRSRALTLLLLPHHTGAGLGSGTGALAGFMILDTAILTQSRFILMESIMMCSGCWTPRRLKFRKVSSTPFHPGSLGCPSPQFHHLRVLCEVYRYLHWTPVLGAYPGLLETFPSRTTQTNNILADCAEGVVQIAIPVVLYLSLSSLTSRLTRPAFHDSLMTFAVQASLGRAASARSLRPASIIIAHGSQVAAAYARAPAGCTLHEHVYPVRYSDGRGSSHQQQVSCYSKDINNWWIIKRPTERS